MMATLTRRLAPALILYATAAAWAEGQDVFKFNASYAQAQDSNLFRLPASANVPALVGRATAAERIGVSSLGLSVNKAYSLQRFELDLTLVDYRYQNFGYLSFAAHNYNAAWRWSLSPRLRGNLTTDRQESQNSFSDYQGYNRRNQRTSTSSRFDGEYELDGVWRLLGGVSKASQTNLQPLAAELDYDLTATEAGVRYAFASGSSFTYKLKAARGSYLNRVLASSGLYDDGFRQLDNELRLRWVFSGQGSADLYASHISRSHSHYSARDYAGLNAGANINWSLSGKTSLTAGWTRELASYQTSSSNYSQTDRLAFGPIWQVSPKTVVRLSWALARRDYLGNPGTALPEQRSDTTRDATLSVDWQPLPYLNLIASLQQARRDSNLAGLDFVSNMVTVSAQLSY